jgi:hypothetical protein
MFYDTGPRMDKKFYDTGHSVYLLSMRAISKRLQPICTAAFHGATTLSMTTLDIPTLSIMKLILTLSSRGTLSFKCHYAESHILLAC